MTSLEKTATAELPVPNPRGGITGPFRYHDFTLLWSGLLFGNIGTWIQFTALGFYVAKLAPNAELGAFYVGLLGASRMIPVLVASPFAGVVADRYPRRMILLSTNVATALTAIVISVCLATGTGYLWVVLVLNGIQGATQSFDAPARQSWISFLVPRELLGNAIGLNSVAFNLPSVAGPPLAGVLIGFAGVAPCMTLNAVLKIVVVLALIFMKPSPVTAHAGKASFLSSFTDGLRYIYGHPALRWVFAMLLATALSVRSYTFLLPAYAVHVVHTDSQGLGVMMGFGGIGAVIGAVLIAALTVRKRGWIWFSSAVVASAGVALLGLTDDFIVACAILALLGLGTQSFIGSSNILVQTLSPEEMRGRVMSIYSMIMIGIVPGGALTIGVIARFTDLRLVLAGAGVVCSLLATLIFVSQSRLRAL